MKKKVLIFVVAFNAETTLVKVLRRIPDALFSNSDFDTEILVIDDASADGTFHAGNSFVKENSAYPLTVLKNPVNLGYGGNQKLGYRYAIDNGFDVVVLLHGDGQYAPEALPEMITPILNGKTDALFGSRMMVAKNALSGGMPLYKFIGNKILTFLENVIVGTRLSEYHSGYRAYSTAALDKVPFERNSNYFDFDTEIIIQLHRAGLKIQEIPIPTFYGDEICYVNGLKYAAKIVTSCVLSRLQDCGIFYDPKFDVTRASNVHYRSKFHFASSHSVLLDRVGQKQKLLILGCGSYPLVRPYLDRGCEISCLDQETDPLVRESSKEYFVSDLDTFDLSQLSGTHYDKVLLPDVIEHLRDPEGLLTKIRNTPRLQTAELLITTPNIAFGSIRLMLLLGKFSYGKSGILDLTHTRLFTFGSIKTCLEQQGYVIEELSGIPAPFPLAVGDNVVGRVLLRLNQWAIRVSKGMFSYQIYCRVRPAPTVRSLLQQTVEFSEGSRRALG